MRPLIVRHEIDGFIADRLLEALWREALWLVADDVATVEEIDDAIRYGAGLRWAAMGTFLTYRLAGGEAGMRHFMAQFGPALQLPWTHLTDVPELTDELLDTIVAQSDAQAGGRSIAELRRVRDDCLVAVAARAQGRRLRRRRGGGAHRARAVRARRARTGQPPLPDGRLRLHEVLVEPSWIDYNGHMTEYRYLEVMADTTDAFLRTIGIVGPYIDAGRSYYTVETHIRHLGEAHGGDRLYVATRLLGHDEKRLHLFHELRRDDGRRAHRHGRAHAAARRPGRRQDDPGAGPRSSPRSSRSPPPSATLPAGPREPATSVRGPRRCRRHEPTAVNFL